MKEMENERVSNKKNYEKTLKELKEKNEQNLKDTLNEIENENIKEKEKLTKKIEDLSNEKSLLSIAINKDAGTLKQFHELGLLKNININENLIQIDPKTNQIKKQSSNVIDEEDIELKNFYDVIINIKSVKDISKGWEIKMTEEGEKNFINFKDKELIKIGVIGNSNKGKSFILSRISKITLPSGTSIKTEGLSIKYPELGKFKNRKIVLLDSAGLETPVLEDQKIIEEEKEDSDEENIYNLNKKNDLNEINKEKIKENNDKKENNSINNENKIENKENNEKEENNSKNNENKRENKEKNESSLINGINKKANKEENSNEDNKNSNIDRDKKEIEKKVQKFSEKSREKLITELFLQSYIIKNSDILILVVGILTYSEQKLLNRIKNDVKKLNNNKALYIIHNLKTFCSKKQVRNYINNYLKKSTTFDLKKGHKISSELKEENGTYYFEKNTNPKIFHLIFANEGSEAGNYYNNFTIKFIEKSYQEVTDLEPFNAIETIKKRFAELSLEIIEKKNENQNIINENDIISNEKIIEEKIIKLKTPQEIVLKRCFIEELGLYTLRGNGFEPSYNYYQKENKLIIRVEAPGNSKITSQVEYSGEYTVIKLTGMKKPDKEPKNNIYNSREFGNFNLVIPLKTQEFNIKNSKPDMSDKKGIIILIYDIENKAQEYSYEGKAEDEV